MQENPPRKPLLSIWIAHLAAGFAAATLLTLAQTAYALRAVATGVVRVSWVLYETGPGSALWRTGLLDRLAPYADPEHSLLTPASGYGGALLHLSLGTALVVALAASFPGALIERALQRPWERLVGRRGGALRSALPRLLPIATWAGVLAAACVLGEGRRAWSAHFLVGASAAAVAVATLAAADRARRLVTTSALLGAPLLAAACALVEIRALGGRQAGTEWSPSAPGTIPPPARVILIGIDTLRADHLSCYGYRRPTSPAIDAVAESEGVRFDRAHAAAPWTLPSSISTMTSLYPSRHQVEHDNATMAPGIPTLASVFRDSGWHSAAFVTHIYVSHLFGFDTGFVEFHEPSVRMDFVEGFQLRANQLTDMALPWLEQHREERFFLYLHYFDPHLNYDPPPPYDTMFTDPQYRGEAIGNYAFCEPFISRDSDMAAVDREHIVALYDGEIAFADHHIGRLFAALRELEMWDDTLLMILADHGEEFEDHGAIGHSPSMFQEVLRVPLIVKLPGGRPEGWRPAVGEVVSNIDIAPTVLDVAGLTPPASFQGRSLVPLMQRPGENATVFSRTLRGGTVAVVVQDQQKLIHTAEEGSASSDLVFDLQHDPSERSSLTTRRPERTENLRNTLFEQARRGRALGPPTTGRTGAVELTPEQIEHLESLGYVD